jgi:Fe2+ or Zn2+ uptake regulation protein
MTDGRIPEPARITRQRTAVLDALRKAPEPLSAKDLRREAGEALFRLCNPVHHHHLVCQRCGRVVEIDACGVDLWASRVAHRYGFAITAHQADVFGVCTACQAGP